MQGLRDGLRKACSSFRCCVAIDAWDAAYVRAVDSADGRHYELRTPTLPTGEEMAKLAEKARRLFSLLAECSSHRRLRLTRATPHSSRRSLLHDSPPLTTLTTHYSGDGQR